MIDAVMAVSGSGPAYVSLYTYTPGDWGRGGWPGVYFDTQYASCQHDVNHIAVAMQLAMHGTLIASS